MQFLVHFLVAPTQTHRVLCHLQSACGHATSINGFAWSEERLRCHKLFGSLCCASHVRYFGHAQWLVGQNVVGICTIQFVLGGARQIDVGLLLPRFATFEECRTLEFLLIGLAHIVAAGSQFQHVFNLLGIQAGWIEDVAVRAADGNYLCTQLRSLLCGTPCHVAESAQSDGLALDVKSFVVQHVLNEVDGAIASCLWTDA